MLTDDDCGEMPENIRGQKLNKSCISLEGGVIFDYIVMMLLARMHIVVEINRSRICYLNADRRNASLTKSSLLLRCIASDVVVVVSFSSAIL